MKGSIMVLPMDCLFVDLKDMWCNCKTFFTTHFVVIVNKKKKV